MEAEEKQGQPAYCHINGSTGSEKEGLWTMEGRDAGMLGWREAELPAQEDVCHHKEAEHPCSKNPCRILRPRLKKEARDGPVSQSARKEITRDLKTRLWGFPGGAVVKNPPANAGDTGSRPGPGRSHMQWCN